MKRAILLGIGLISLAVLPAAGADMPARVPVKAPVAAPEVWNWTGFYIGGNAGGIINNSSYELDPTGCFLTGCGVGGIAANANRTFTNKLNKAAFTGGGQIGYNWQTGSFVWGLETDFNFSGINESDTLANILTGPLVGGVANTTVTQRLDWFGTFRGRLGFTPAPPWLLYVTGGLAYGHINSGTSVQFPVTCCAGDTYIGSISSTRLGWTIGGGVEWMFARNWSVKAEYLFVDLGSFSYLDPCVAACGAGATLPSYTTNLTTREHIARAGLNYKFDWGGPVVARY
jgi:outer membrane immunogenic protein